MGRVLAIEPEASKAEALRQIVRNDVGAEFVLVTSAYAAVVAINRQLPDLFSSANPSPIATVNGWWTISSPSAGTEPRRHCPSPRSATETVPRSSLRSAHHSETETLPAASLEGPGTTVSGARESSPDPHRPEPSAEHEAP